LEATFKSYGAELGYDIVITDADGDVATQINQVEDFITQGVDIILIAVADPDALIDPIQEAIDAGIPVICYDGGINSDIAATKCIFDFYEDGAIVGEWAIDYINENLGGTAKVAILDFPASPIVCGQRAQGFAETVSQLEGVEIVAQQDGKASRTDSMSVMENILTANPDVDLVYGINYDTGAGAAAAIQAANSSAIVCCNAWGQEGFQQLEDNDPIMKCMAASSPVTQAKDALDAVAPALAGEELPKETLSHSTLLTAENIGDFDWESIIAARTE
jgi:ribose transport system substrate-binding protein